MSCCGTEYVNPDVEDFKVWYSRDFAYGNSANACVVTNTDITKAMTQADNMISSANFCSQEAYTQGFLSLSAHYLVMNLRASSQGLRGQFPWMQNSKAVATVSESFTIPDKILENPQLAWLSKTYYGAEYLMQILPALTGNAFAVLGRTHA